jgi:hypothetical protein
MAPRIQHVVLSEMILMPPPSPDPQAHRFMTFVRYSIVVLILTVVLIIALRTVGILPPFWNVPLHVLVHLPRTVP